MEFEKNVRFRFRFSDERRRVLHAVPKGGPDRDSGIR
jgi:hypothetical protein